MIKPLKKSRRFGFPHSKLQNAKVLIKTLFFFGPYFERMCFILNGTKEHPTFVSFCDLLSRSVRSLVECCFGDCCPLQPQVEVLSEEEGEEEDEEEDILSLAEEKYRPAALEKMIALIALLVEQSRSER